MSNPLELTDSEMIESLTKKNERLQTKNKKLKEQNAKLLAMVSAIGEQIVRAKVALMNDEQLRKFNERYGEQLSGTHQAAGS